MAFTYGAFVASVREAVRQDETGDALAKVMADTLADPAAVAKTVPPQDEDEIHLFEDEAVSIWSCRFQPDVVMPAHEHKMPAWIGVFAGAEKNIIYKREGGGLEEVRTTVVRPGELLMIGDDQIHAVTAEGPEPSHALHVYLGPLTKIERELFDWESGEAVSFTMDNFEKMKKSKRE